MEFYSEDLIKLGLAVLVGGLIGMEREFREKAAGFRTLIFISLGSTLFTMLSLNIGNDLNPTRIAANIVTGIGFLGAGAIMRDQGKVAGLTTAATIWLVAALGMGLGAGKYMLVGVSTVIILVVLWGFPWIERVIESTRHTVIYQITLAVEIDKLAELQNIFKACGLNASIHRRVKEGRNITSSWYVFGKPRIHERMLDTLLKDNDILEIKY
jgi:putative Mg2+ transporter-C (MgtC) family protein